MYPADKYPPVDYETALQRLEDVRDVYLHESAHGNRANQRARLERVSNLAGILRDFIASKGSIDGLDLGEFIDLCREEEIGISNSTLKVDIRTLQRKAKVTYFPQIAIRSRTWRP